MFDFKTKVKHDGKLIKSDVIPVNRLIIDTEKFLNSHFI